MNILKKLLLFFAAAIGMNSFAFTVNVDMSTLRIDVAAGVKKSLAAQGVNSRFMMDSQLASVKLGGRHLVTFGETGAFMGQSNSPFPEDFTGTAVHFNYEQNDMLRLGREEAYRTANCMPMEGVWPLMFVPGGRWVTSIQALPGSATHAVAIYHREYDWCERWGGREFRTTQSRSPEAYATGMLYTTDGGRTWVDRGNVLTGAHDLALGQFLGTPGASGLIANDGYVYVFYFDYGGRWGSDLRIARSTEPVTPANIGSLQFRKRSSSSNRFTEPAMTGSLLKGTGTQWMEKISGLSWPSNNNTPHVHWNRDINSYVMTYKNWNEDPNGPLVTLKVAFSSNLLDWSDSQDLLKIYNPGGIHVYGSIIGESSSAAGARAWIYFNAGSGHQMNRVAVTFGQGPPSSSKPGVVDASALNTVTPIFSSYSFPSKFMLKMPGKGNLCVDDGGGTSRGQTQFLLWPCQSNNANQVFTYDATNKQIRSASKANLCLDDGGAWYPGQAKMHLWDCLPGHVNQQFEYDFSTKMFRNPTKNLCMDDGGGWQPAQTRFHLWSCVSGHTNQKFEIVPIFMLKAPGKNNLCVDDGGGVVRGQTQFHLWTCDKNNINQHFSYDPSTKAIKSASKHNLCVDDGGGWYAGQTKFHLWDCMPGNQNQIFEYDAVNKMFRNPSKNNLCMDDGGGSHSGQTKFHLWDCVPWSQNQKFEVIVF